MSGVVLRVLDTSLPARQVAEDLGLERVVLHHAGSDTPVLVVLTDSSEVASVAQLRATHDVRALVAWNLDEADVLRILEGQIPVFIGQPSLEELRALTWWGESRPPTDADRELAARLAILEDAFEASARA